MVEARILEIISGTTKEGSESAYLPWKVEGLGFCVENKERRIKHQARHQG